MAIGIAEYVFTAAGQRIYPVAAKINGVNYVRVTLDDVPFTDSTQFDIINNSIVFTDEAAPSTGVEVKIYIATSEEFLSNFDVGVANPTNLDVVGEDLALGEESVITIVGNNIAYIRDAADNALDISTVATSIDDINTVADIANNITTVANNTTNINTVASNNNNITAVADNNTNITAVANNATNITAVANNATNINAVNSNKTNIDTVAANNSNITTVSGISTKVTTVANNIDDVGNVSDNMLDINDVQDSLDDITTVSGAVGNVNTVATNIAKVSTVSTNIANVNTVADNITNVNTVATNNTNINTVATNNTNINTVATNINDINSIVDDIANIDIVANNIEDINTFSDTYFISATTPTSPTEGDLWFDTVNNIMKVYDGSNFVAAYATLSGALIASNNLSDLEDVGEARTNLGLDDTDSVNFGSVTANTFTLEDAPIGAGIFSWNSDEVTADLTQNGSTLQLGQEFQYSVINQSGVDIPNATVVAAVGTIGASGKIKIAKWNASTMGTKYILGITTEAINNGSTGKVTKDGKVRDVDTGNIAGTYTDGVIYASTSTAGGLTYDKPTDKAIALAFLISAETAPSANNGTIMVRNTVFDENEYQAKLVSGTNIKTINSTSLLGSGDIAVQATLVSGTNIKTVNGSILLGSGDVPVYTGFKNRIINGAMMIDQRKAGASVTPASGTYNNYCVDRFPFATDGGGRITAQQSTTVPTGFSNSLSLTVQTVDSSIGSGDQYWLEQRIEGNNLADMGFGTANASTFTLSFWVRSSVTGTYSISLRSTAGSTRSYVATYVINSANTWEQKVITVAGDTSGTWLTTNGIGIMVMWDLGSGSNFNGTAGSWQATNLYRTSGSVNWISNAGATFYITGVQLEKGSVATPFENRPYSTELALCQRYYEKSFATGTAPADGVYTYYTLAGSSDTSGGNTYFECLVAFKTIKRVVPTITIYGSSGTWQYKNVGPYIAFGVSPFTSANTITEYGTLVGMGYVSGTSDLYRVRMVRGDWTASAEL